MYNTLRLKQLILLAGDIITLYFSLAMMLLLRYGENNIGLTRVYNAHIESFSFIFAAWIAVFYIAGLYDIRSSKNDFQFLKRSFYALLVAAGAAVLYFYFIPALITPKTNLFMDAGFATILLSVWRNIFVKSIQIEE
ncbi:MAG: hypothetical protein HYT82_01560 [Candidatus Harrisonbacteria bacterium]|nr:hypothetical protein [Candidatus Harrisonbacteria bacterium]